MYLAIAYCQVNYKKISAEIGTCSSGAFFNRFSGFPDFQK